MERRAFWNLAVVSQLTMVKISLEDRGSRVSGGEGRDRELLSAGPSRRIRCTRRGAVHRPRYPAFRGPERQETNSALAIMKIAVREDTFHLKPSFLSDLGPASLAARNG